MNIDGDHYTITERKTFEPHVTLTEEWVDKCFQFAKDMTFGEKGAHRVYRSGGTAKRKPMEIFKDTFQGKISECAFYIYFKDRYNVSEPDFSVSGLGIWDLADFVLEGKLVAIKSTKKFGNLLLLEKKDWDENGNYIPNQGKDHEYYDLIFLSRVSTILEEVLKKNKLYYSDFVSKEKVIHKLIKGESWTVEITGYITHSQFVDEVIRERQIIPKGATLNQYTVMDAENYYVEAGNLRLI